ncbi:MAG: hypothetical protein Q9187_005072 [Circinaria calcarea]
MVTQADVDEDEEEEDEDEKSIKATTMSRKTQGKQTGVTEVVFSSTPDFVKLV